MAGGLFLPRGFQSGDVRVDAKSPLSAGLLFCLDPTREGVFDVVTGDRAAYGAEGGAASGLFGRAILTGPDSNTDTMPAWTTTVNRQPTTEATMVWMGFPTTIGNWGAFMCLTWASVGKAGSSGNPYFTIGMQAYAADMQMRSVVATSSSAFVSTPVTGVPLTTSRPMLVALRFNRGYLRNDRRYLDGAREWDFGDTSSGPASLIYNGTPGDLRVSRQEGGPGVTGTLYGAFLWDRYLLDDELWALAMEPFSMLTR